MANSGRPPLIDRLLKEHWKILLVLLIGLVHAVIYLRLIPPWQHYDEPGHVEFAWLIADRMHIPQGGEYDQSMRREMAASMIEFDFFRNLDFRPNLLSHDEPIWIGHAQVFGLPLYYIYLALPLKLVHYSDITFQLYLARSTSLLLYLFTILAAYGIMREITPQDHPLRWLVPLSLALLPGFVDIMTAVNDDVGATAAFSLFLWAGVSIIQRGFSWRRSLALAITTIACALTKNTVIVAILLAGLPVLIRLFRNVRRRYLWAGLALAGVFLSFSVLRFGDASAWHRNTSQYLSTKVSRGDTPIGRDALQFNSARGVFQLLSLADSRELKGKTVTLGAWIWADTPIQVQEPSLRFNNQETKQIVEVNRKPVFHAYSTRLPDDLTQLVVAVTPGVNPEKGDRVYYDGIILVEGDYSAAGIPSAGNVDASQITWGDTNLRNYIRNASAEQNWFVIRPTVGNLLNYYVPGTPNLYLSLLQDWRSATWYYQVTLDNLLQTFWGKFGWGHVPLKGRITYPLLALVSITGIVGAGISIARQRGTLPLNAYLFLFLSGAVIWLFTLLRGLTSIMEILFIPSSRYAYPAIVPTMLALNMGWLEIGRLLFGERNRRLLGILLLIFFVSLDILALVSVMVYYR